MPRDRRTRREPFREPKRTILVYCGAERTEPDYFEGFKSLLERASVTVKVRATGTDPVRLIKAAADYRARKPGVYDEVWCVFDVDRFDVAKAVAEAEKRDIQVAVSNPCFELWLLLHHADCRGHCADYEAVVLKLKKHLPLYDKSGLDFAEFAGGVHDAVRRAEALEPSGVEYAQNPSSSVWVLVKRLLEHAS